MATLRMTLGDPNHPQVTPLLRFGSSFISLEQLKLESSYFITGRPYQMLAL